MTDDRMYVLPHPVAILDEHLLRDEKGKEICYLDGKYLQRIADNNNRRVALTGDTCPIVIGHTDDDLPETEQPEIVGDSDNYFVASGRKEGQYIVPDPTGKGKKYLFCRWRVYEDNLDALRKFPRRSVELWTSRWEVDPISLLGATTPDRDLGRVRMSKKGRSVKILFKEHKQMAYENEPELEGQEGLEESNQPLTLAQLDQLDWVQGIKALLAEMDQEQQQVPEEGLEGEQPPEEGVEGGEEVPQGEEPEEQETGEEEPVQESAGYPGVSSTHVPELERTQMSRSNPDRVRLERVERAVVILDQENAQLRVQLARKTREGHLRDLEAEGIDLDVAEELDLVAPEEGVPMPDAQYNAYLDRIRKQYRRSPVAKNQPNFAQVGRTGHVRKTRSDDERKALVQKALLAAEGNPAKYDEIINAGEMPGAEKTL